MDEFAMGSSTENSAFGIRAIRGMPRAFPAARPAVRRRRRSGRNDCRAWLGHRRLHPPAGGIVRLHRLETTYGRVSRYGLVAFASSLDQIGSLTKDVRDAATLLGSLVDTIRDSRACRNRYRIMRESDRRHQGLKLACRRNI